MQKNIFLLYTLVVAVLLCCSSCCTKNKTQGINTARLSERQYFNTVNALMHKYDNDNSWFRYLDGGLSWSSGTWNDFVQAGWVLYKNVLNNKLKLILLGDTKIRSDEELLMNFGIAGNSNSPQEHADKEIILKIKKYRSSINKTHDSSFMKSGSILSVKRWSPLLNDSLILAGTTIKADFILALSGMDADSFQKIKDKKNHYDDPLYANMSYYQALWLDFFTNSENMLWDHTHGVPRVLVREVLGLQALGYRPVFDYDQLSFVPSQDYNTKNITFKKYLYHLKKCSLDKNNKKAILNNVWLYLFGKSREVKDV